MTGRLIWTKDRVENFLAKYPIGNCESLYKHKITIRHVTFDRQYYVTIPYWNENKCIVTRVLNLAYHASLNKNVDVFLESRRIIIRFYQYARETK